MTDIATRRAASRKLYDNFFVLPNATDAGEAKTLADLVFKATVLTSHGRSLALGKDDLTATPEDTLANLCDLVAAIDLPANADFEAGFAGDADGGACNITLVAEAGVACLAIGDRKGDALYALDQALNRIRGVQAVLDAGDPKVVLVGGAMREGRQYRYQCRG